MALPIQATPVLEGEDAERFYKKMAEDAKRGVPMEEVERALKNVKGSPQFMKMFNINLDWYHA
jgi:hypothetical protein